MKKTDKHIVFFSHSSKDKAILDELKTLLVQKTGNAIEIFLSSDGQSIRLGKNWAHRIEDALKKAKISFVFVSPNSLQSKWLFFESGFSYARDIQVIPVGILGIDLDGIPPPLNILQGFNIRNEDGLNNILSTLNKEFELNFPESFTLEEYNKIFLSQENSSQNGMGVFSQYIDHLKVIISKSEILERGLNIEECFPLIYESLSKNNTPYNINENSILGFGFSISFTQNELIIELDPNLTKINFSHVESILSCLKIEKEYLLNYYIVFINEVEEISKQYQLTSRLYNTGITLGVSGNFKFNNIIFSIGHFRTFSFSGGVYKPSKGQTYVKISQQDRLINNDFLVELLYILFNKSILMTEQIPYL